MVRQAARRVGPGVTAEDKIKLEILAGRLGLSQEDVKAGVQLLLAPGSGICGRR